jgi:hypothetical protein
LSRCSCNNAEEECNDELHLWRCGDVCPWWLNEDCWNLSAFIVCLNNYREWLTKSKFPHIYDSVKWAQRNFLNFNIYVFYTCTTLMHLCELASLGHKRAVSDGSLCETLLYYFDCMWSFFLCVFTFSAQSSVDQIWNLCSLSLPLLGLLLKIILILNPGVH